MKKYILTFVFALVCTVSFGAKNTFTVTSGSTDVLKKAATYKTVFNYSNTNVNQKPLADFLASKEEKFRKDWDAVILPGSQAVGANVMYLATNKNWMPAADEAEYTVTYNFTDIELGYVAVVGGPKTGGAQLKGTATITDNATGQTVCEILFFVAGSSAFSDKDRLSIAYAYMGKDLKKFLKKN